MSNQYAVGENYIISSPHILPGYLTSVYDYLKRNVIACDDNKDLLTSRVSEIYFELLSESGATEIGWEMYPVVIPSPASIASVLDSENIEAIDMYGQSTGLSTTEIDTIIAVYCHDVACMLDDWAGEILWAIGFPVRNDAHINSGHDACVSNYNTAQIKFDYWEVWANGRRSQNKFRK